MTAIATPARPGYTERRSDLSSVTFRGKCVLDSKERALELILAHSSPDEDADAFENLVLPLKVLLVESYDSEKNPGEKTGYEDMYLFTHDGDFMGHLHRSFTRVGTGVRHYDQPNFRQDGDISKLYRYGEAIKGMINGTRLGYPLENHPTVVKLRTHTLWEG